MTTAVWPSSVDRHSIIDFVRSALADTAVRPNRHDFVAAGIVVRFESNEPSLCRSYAARLAGAAGEAPAYRLDASTAARLPVWADERCAPRMLHRILEDRGLRAAYPYRQGVWHLLDLGTGRGAQLVSSVDHLPPWDSGAPLRQHLHWILRAHRMRLVHASSLGEAGQGVLFVGNSGTGKSGVALAGLSVGLKTVGDDYLALSVDDGVLARPVYRIIKQDLFGIAKVPQLALSGSEMPTNWKGKVELDPDLHFPGSFAGELTIRAVVVPRIAGLKRPRLVPASRGSAMLALMRSNLHQFPGEDDDGMRFFGNVLRQVPVFMMELSGDFQRNGDAIRSFLGAMEKVGA